MEIPNAEDFKKSGQEFLWRCFESLKKKRSYKSIGSTLSGISIASEYLSTEQLKNIYSYKDTKSSAIKQGMVEALTGIQTRQAIEICSSLASDNSKNVRYRAVFALVYYVDKPSKKIREILWQRLADHEQQIQELAVFGLAKYGDVRVKEILRRKLIEEGPEDYLIWSICELRALELLVQIKEGDIIKATNTQVDYDMIEKLKINLLTN